MVWCGLSGAAIRTLRTLQPAASGTARQALDWHWRGDSAPDIYKNWTSHWKYNYTLSSCTCNVLYASLFALLNYLFNQF